MAQSTLKSPTKFKNIFMEETSPDNPFGPNYHLLPYNAKIGYKFNRIKGFIKPTRQDLLKKQDQDLKFTGTLLIGFAGGVFVGGLGRVLLKRVSPGLDALLGHSQHWYYSIIASVSTAEAYFRAYDRYYVQVCKYFIDKYLPQAIKNGFEDYQISK